MAGPIAQRRFHARSYRSPHAGSDYERASAILSALAGSEKENKAYWKLLDIQTRQLLQQDFILITHTMPLEGINKDFDLMHAGEAIRSVVVY